MGRSRNATQKEHKEAFKAACEDGKFGYAYQVFNSMSGRTQEAIKKTEWVHYKAMWEDTKQLRDNIEAAHTLRDKIISNDADVSAYFKNKIEVGGV